MVLVLAIRNQRLAVVRRQQAESLPVIPAARALAQVAAGRPHVANLRAGNAARRIRQRFVLVADIGVGGQLIHGDQRADAQPGRGLLDALQFLDALDVHHPLGRVDVVLHEAQEVCAAGQDIRMSPLRRQQPEGLLERCGIGVFEGLHYAFLPSIPKAASTRSGVSGTLGTRTPMALATALPIAAQMAMAGGSPRPMTPRLSFSGRMSMCTTMSPMSSMPASL